MRHKLPQVTLLGIDCVNIKRLQAAMDVSEKEIEFSESKLLTSLPTDDRRLVKIANISSAEDFSEFCIKELHKFVETEYVLLVQYDGFVLNPQLWNSEFLKYDYIGAPCSGGLWSVKDFNKPDSSSIVGNGGFSLRSKKFLETSARLAKEGKITKFHPEDVSMCVWHKDLFEKEGIKFAPVDLAMEFSVLEGDGTYEKPFGFHGLLNKNMDELLRNYPDFPIHFFLPRIRVKRLEKIIEVFKERAIEAHTFGSVARGDADLYSDLDIWLTFEDNHIKDVIEKRFEYYSKIGEIVHICEPPQNSPVNGIHTFVIYKTKVGLLPVDFYLCPQSSSFKTKDSKNILGKLELPFGELGMNSQKAELAESYRLDFFICFIFNAIKKIFRKDEAGLERLFNEYNWLSDRYGIQVKELESKDYTFETLETIIENINSVSTGNQKKALKEITTFMEAVRKNEQWYN